MPSLFTSGAGPLFYSQSNQNGTMKLRVREAPPKFQDGVCACMEEECNVVEACCRAFLRCAEINAEVLLKATNVDGVYDDDPRQNQSAHLLDSLSYQEVMSTELSVMDMTTITLCQENNIPIVVFNLVKPGNISRAIKGERVGTIIGAKQQPRCSGDEFAMP
ncbi:hypothetical protein Droror1_Dr00015158 [Drosera rotundifolia]